MTGGGRPRDAAATAAMAIVGFVALCVYLPTLGNGFVWDDHFLVEGNRFIRGFDRIGELFRADIFAGAGRPGDFYRPLQGVTYAVEHALWGLWPGGYHLTSAVLHAADTVLVFLLVRLLGGPVAVATVAGLLFGVHPVQSEAVAYVSGRAEPLALLFMLLCVMTFVRFDRTRRWWLYASSLACYFGAMLSKEAGVVAPLLAAVVWLVSERSRPGALRASRFVFLMIPYAAVAVLHFLALRGPAVAGAQAVSEGGGVPPLGERLMALPVVLVEYLKVLAWPVGLHAMRTLPPPERMWPWGFVVSLAVVISVAVVVVLLCRQSPLARLGLVWFFVALLPHLNVLLPLQAPLAEHWLYFSMVGFGLLVAVGIESLALNAGRRLVAVRWGVAASLCAVLAFLAVARSRDWSDDERFYRRTIAVAPPSAKVAVAHFNLANFYRRSARRDGGTKALAEKHFLEAVRLNPGHVAARVNLGNLYADEGKAAQAIEQYRAALEIEPDSVEALLALGETYLGAHDEAQAEEQFRKALTRGPRSGRAHLGLASALYNQSRIDEARQALERALRIDPLDEEARARLWWLEEHPFSPIRQ